MAGRGCWKCLCSSKGPACYDDDDDDDYDDDEQKVNIYSSQIDDSI